MSVIQVTSTEFRERQAFLLDLADQGKRVIIRRGKKRAYVLTPVSEEDCWLSPEGEKRIELSREQYKAGNVIICKTAEDAIKHLESL